jgi:hypothetical protein
MSNVIDERPRSSVPVPGFPDITVVVHQVRSHDVFFLNYYGWPADLIAAGIMPAELLEPTGKRHINARGEPVPVARYWRLKDGHPQRYCKVSHIVSTASIDLLPGARDAVAAYERLCDRSEASAARRRRQDAPAKAPEPRPALRLVVDNTKGSAA